HPAIIVSRLRPGFVFQRAAATEITGLFAGHLIPVSVLRWLRTPILPLPRQMIAQVVHLDDVADAFWRAIDRSAAGAFNIAAEPIIDPPTAAAAFGIRWVPVRLRVVRALADLTWKLRLQGSDP